MACLCLTLVACQQHPTEINGRPVLRIKKVDGKPVYILGEKPGDKEETKRMAMEAEEAAKDVIFRGKK